MSALDTPIFLHSRPLVADWVILPSWLPVPGMGVLPVNSFLLKGREPLLVDTGLGMLGDDFMTALQNEIDLEDLRWVWLSHADYDHIGNLKRVLDVAPNAKVITNFLGAGKMGLAGFDLARTHLLEAETAIEVGGRRLSPVRPPYYDAPETIGFFEETGGVLFVADCFGALLPEVVTEIGEVPRPALCEGIEKWASTDAPWLAAVDQAAFRRTLSAFVDLDPALLLSSHLLPSAEDIPGLVQPIFEAFCGEASLPGNSRPIEYATAAME